MKSRLVSLLMAALAGAYLLAGCGEDDDADSSGGAGTDDGAGTGGRAAVGGTGTGDGDGDGTGGSGTGGRQSSADLWVMGSHPDYQWGQVPAAEVPWSHLTHIFLGFLEPTGSAGVYDLAVTGFGPATMEEWSAAAGEFIDAAHAAGVSVLVDLGGMGGADEVFIDACSSPANTTAFATMLATELTALGFDGLDLDWEGASYDGTCAATLLTALRAAWSEAVLVTAVGPVYGDTQVAQMNDLGAAADALDGVLLMSYIPPDQTWTWWVVPVPVTPLYGATPPWGTAPQNYSVDRDREVLTAAGFPSSKLVMGIAGFGLVWGDTNADGTAPVTPYANTTATGAADTELSPLGCSDNQVTQLWLDEALAAAGSSLTLHTDEVGEVEYWAAASTTALVSLPNPCGAGQVDAGLILYETPASIGNKLAYVEDESLRGVFFWTMAQTIDASGDFPLLEAARP
jgi:GH18 family chitinase